MKSFAVFAFAVLANVAADAPPLPYAAAGAGTGVAQSASFSNDRIQSVGNQYVEHYSPDGFNIQSGYESYLIPAAEHGLFPLVDGLEFKGHGLISKILKNLVAVGGKIIPKIALGAAVLFSLFLIGGCVNALICTFTPFCTISFLGFGVTKDTMRSYFTPDKISSTATFVMDAIKKYKNMYETASNEIETVKKADMKRILS